MNKPTTFKFSKYYNTRGYAYFLFEDIPYVQSQLEDIITNLWSLLLLFGKDHGYDEPSPDQYCLNGQIDDGRKIRINMIFYGIKIPTNLIYPLNERYFHFNKTFVLKRSNLPRDQFSFERRFLKEILKENPEMAKGFDFIKLYRMSISIPKNK
uniref:Uncharacterized protein n=1 Tax=Inonotus obliquus TaxID=167356 RepID=A0A5A4UC30_9AGAM|nr:hypothetical protein [Inonotus obliquus]BBN21276.1 hypothetical protein [Inonotus obliquus]